MSESSSPGRNGDHFDSLNVDDFVFVFTGNNRPTEPPSPQAIRLMEERRERYLRALAYCKEHNLPTDGVEDVSFNE
jgi:hypothetical protein